MHIHNHRSVTYKNCQVLQTKAIGANPHCTHPGKYCIISITETLRKSYSVQTETFKNHLFEAFIYWEAFHNSCVFFLRLGTSAQLPNEWADPSLPANYWVIVKVRKVQRGQHCVVHERKHDVSETWTELKELESSILVIKDFSLVSTNNQSQFPCFWYFGDNQSSLQFAHTVQQCCLFYFSNANSQSVHLLIPD